MESLRVLRDLAPGHGGFPLGFARRAGCYESTEVLVTGPVLYEESDARRFVICDL